ncbi:MAG: DUF1501 domain-containing protein [Gemmataceae bacterium]|nr:DUF1501 domain-containing protein [Gemmataceae bacterium]
MKIATRREFLTQGLGLIGVGAALPNFLINTALGGPQAQPDQPVLVVLQLSGGNDAMSTLVPHGHREYHEYRRVTRITESEVIRINDELGLHPNLRGWKQMLDDGAFVAIPGVGYPNPNFSHFTSTDIWFFADQRGRQAPHGWIGRACDVGFRGNPDPKLSIAVGSESTPLALLGREHPGICFNQPASFGYVGLRGRSSQGMTYRRVNAASSSTPTGELQWVTSTAVAANNAADEIRPLATQYRPRAEYPNTPLATRMRTIASLICGGLTTRIYWTSQGGFDTHGNQRPGHDTLMTTLNDAITAFYRDLRAQGKDRRVLLMTMSEFGRTSRENGSQGTDHAAAASLFLFGPGLRAGIHGRHPSLREADLIPSGNSLRHTTDFRSVYATVLERWLRIPSAAVLGQRWPLIDCIA